MTFLELCSETEWAAIVEYQEIFNVNALGFLDHMHKEPDRDLSAGQANFAEDLIQRALFQQQFDRGQYRLPPTLGCRPTANDNLPALQDGLHKILAR